MAGLTAMRDYQFKEWMASANLSLFTVRLKQHGYFTLRDIASSKQCASGTFLKSLGMSSEEIERFLVIRDMACEVFNLQHNNEVPTHRAPPTSTATSDIIDVSLPLNVTFDKELKVLKIGENSQVSSQEVGRRVVSVAGIVVRNTKEFKKALENSKSTSSACELVYVDAKKAAPMSVPGQTITKKPPPPPSQPPRRSSQPPPPRLEAEEDEDEALRAAIEASKLEATPKKPPIDDEDEALRAAIEASKLEATPKKPPIDDQSEEQILAAVIMASSSEMEREEAMKRREAEVLKREEELLLRAALAESEVSEVRGRLASTDQSIEWARRESMQLSSMQAAASGAVVVSGAEIYKIPREKLKLEDTPFAKGGGGQIFKGKYTGNEIAAKQVFSNMMKEDDRAEFDIEVATLTKLSHPCIMACYGMCEEDNGDLFMVLEYCGGGDLDAFYQSPEFTKLEFNRVVGELLSGISYIHARSIAHRDLKPANVLLDRSRKVKIADFGLARQDHIKVERGIGTPAYMPPEMLVEGDEATHVLAIDVYAMGIIMWQLWFRQVPFDGKAVHKIMSMVTRGKRPPMDKGDDLPPTKLQNLISSCWAQDHDIRPSIDQVFASFDEDIAPIIERDFKECEPPLPPDLRSLSSSSNDTTQLTF